MQKFPAEFADLLTQKGRRILARGVPALTDALARPDRQFVALSGAIDPAKARTVPALLARTMAAHMVELAKAIPPESITNQTRNYQERLPKVARMQTAYLERAGSKSWRAASRVGLVAMLRSPSFRRFAEVIAGRKLASPPGVQVHCYRPGDYAGPHTDHHPEDAAAKDGYLDVHLTFSSDGVAQQYLVYVRDGHLTDVVDVNSAGGITIYRLPFWHYTTPLVAKRGRDGTARRWVLLGTFLFAP
jgi:hypothetical protein